MKLKTQGGKVQGIKTSCADIAALLKKAQAGQKKARVSKSALRIEAKHTKD